MSPISAALKVAFNELFHCLECWCCLRGVAAVHLSPERAGAAGECVCGGARFPGRGGAWEGQEEEGCFCFVCLFKGREGRSWRQKQWTHVIIRSIWSALRQGTQP